MPRMIVLFSGKRKSGKDYIVANLNSMLGDRGEIVKISEPIKHHWAVKNNLSLDELLSDSQYKEKYRLEMINWSEKMRDQDYGCFCTSACYNAKESAIWLVSDIRRKTDIKWFKENYPDIVYTVRITADENTRKDRGYMFVEGVDDVASECDLDDYDEWHLTINNGKNRLPLESQMGLLLQLISRL